MPDRSTPLTQTCTAEEECGTCGDTTCTAPGTAAHLYCAVCRWPHGEHRFVECDTFTPEATAP